MQHTRAHWWSSQHYATSFFSHINAGFFKLFPGDPNFSIKILHDSKQKAIVRGGSLLSFIKVWGYIVEHNTKWYRCGLWFVHMVSLGCFFLFFNYHFIGFLGVTENPTIPKLKSSQPIVCKGKGESHSLLAIGAVIVAIHFF